MGFVLSLLSCIDSTLLGGGSGGLGASGGVLGGGLGASGGLTGSLDDVDHLLSLTLGTNVRTKLMEEDGWHVRRSGMGVTGNHGRHTGGKTYSLLAVLEGTLVLADTKQFHASLLVGGKSAHLTDDIAHKLDTLVELLLSPSYQRRGEGYALRQHNSRKAKKIAAIPK